MNALSDFFNDIEVSDKKLKVFLQSAIVVEQLQSEINSKLEKLETDALLTNILFINNLIECFEEREEIDDYHFNIGQRKVSVAELYNTYLELINLNSEYVKFVKSDPLRRGIENRLESLMNLSVLRSRSDHDGLMMYLREPITKILYATFIEPVISSNSDLINEKFTNGETLLMMQIRLRCKLYMIEELLHLGADPNSIDDNGCTPPMYTTCCYPNAYNMNLVLLLKEYGADFEIFDKNGIRYGKYYLIYKIGQINSESAEYVYKVGKESPSLKRLEALNSADGPLKYFPLGRFNEEDKISPEEYFQFSEILSKNYKHLPIPLFIRNSPSWIFSEINYKKIKDSQPDLYQKIINWD
jgi:hypothetical protein